MAIWQRKPPHGLIVHSDRGPQYASKEYRNLIKMSHFVERVSKKDDCGDKSY